MTQMVKKLLACIFMTALCGTVAAQELFFSGEVSTHFDNTEYTGSDCGTSRTIFAVRMTPTIGYRWNDRHSVIVGAELLKDFGSSRFLDDANMVAYYRFKNEKYGAYAGIFERDNLIGRASRGTEVDIAIETSDMSMDRRHCIIHVKEKGSRPQLTLRDNPSLTGTFLRNTLLGDRERALLHDGDVVSIGAATFIVHIPGEEDDEYCE